MKHKILLVIDDNKPIEVAVFKGLGDLYLCLPALQKAAPSNYHYMYHLKYEIALHGAKFHEDQFKKVFRRQDNIGKAKYTVSKHDGIQVHNDGSPFYDIAIFKNKKKLEKYIRDLEKEGYVEE